MHEYEGQTKRSPVVFSEIKMRYLLFCHMEITAVNKILKLFTTHIILSTTIHSAVGNFNAVATEVLMKVLPHSCTNWASFHT